MRKFKIATLMSGLVLASGLVVPSLASAASNMCNGKQKTCNVWMKAEYGHSIYFNTFGTKGVLSIKVRKSNKKTPGSGEEVYFFKNSFNRNSVLRIANPYYYGNPSDQYIHAEVVSESGNKVILKMSYTP